MDGVFTGVTIILCYEFTNVTRFHCCLLTGQQIQAGPRHSVYKFSVTNVGGVCRYVLGFASVGKVLPVLVSEADKSG